MTPTIVLVGLMGTGKTTVGAILAERLRRPFLDSDAHIEAAHGRTVRDIWRSEGEPFFRELEAAALTEALERDDAPIVAAAGGVVLAEANRERLRSSGAEVIWLRARPETLHTRIAATTDHHRPLLDDDPLGALHRMATEREPLYEEVATLVVDVDERTPAEVAKTIVTALAVVPEDLA